MVGVAGSKFREIDARLAAGERLTRDDALALLRSDDLLAVGALADRARRQRHGDRVVFVRNQHVNYSNVCRSRCRFCAFGVAADDARAYTLTHDSIVEKARAGVAQGARQLHVVGGIHPDLPFAWYVAMIERLRAAFPDVHIKAFTAVEIDEMARRERLSARDVLERLMAAGLDSLPGGGAEVLSDRLRAALCPNKASAARWLEIMRIAHGLGLRSTATMLYGHVETPDERVDHLLALRALQDETGGFTCFVPLAFQPAHTGLSDLPPVAAADSLKTIAVARLLLDNFDHIKAYWIVLGVKLAQVALSFGADDLHGTVLDEQIAHEAGAASPRSLSVADLIALIKEAGFVPVERDALCSGGKRREVPGRKAGQGVHRQDACATGPIRDSPRWHRLPAGDRWHRLPACDEVDAILSCLARGERLTDTQAERLFACDDLPAFGRAADAVRRRLHNPRSGCPCHRDGEAVVTYVVDRNVNYTNVCASGCRFCAFYRAGDAAEAYVIDRETLRAKIRETVALGGTQILLQGGMNPDLPLEWYEDLLRWIHDEFDIHVHGFSPPEIVHLARKSDLGIGAVIERLHAAGLNTIPGGGAEILSDRVRREISPRKCSADQWIEVMREAHRFGLRTTATMMFGHVETAAERVEHLRRVRDLQDETGGFTAFIPWTYQPAHTALGGRAAGAHDYLKTLAIARLYLDNVLNLQASWVTQGREICQVALFFGANDLGSTMIEENVVRAAGVEYRLTRADLDRIIRQIGRVPRQRDCYYHLIESKAVCSSAFRRPNDRGKCV